MYSIAPVLRRISRRHLAQIAEGDAWLDVDEAAVLWGAVLDGAVPDLELGALLASFAHTLESTDELVGLHRALASRSSRWSLSISRRPVALPVYGLFPGEAPFAVLLAMFLRRFDVPVVVHGPLDARSGPSAAVLLRELGVMPSATLTDANRELREHGVAFVPVQLLSPALAQLLSLRTRLGTTSAAHCAAQALDPGGIAAVRLAMSISGTASERLAAFHRAIDGDTLMLSWPTGTSPANLALRPHIARVRDGTEDVLFEAESPDRGIAAVNPPADLVPWIRAVCERAAAAPVPLVNLASACLHATGASADFTQAKAIVALQSGRLAA
jgi:anthranilate phosphoribosyltransferase